MARSAPRRQGQAHGGAKMRADEARGSRAFARLGRLLRIPPPQRGETGDAVFGQRIGMTEAIPASGAVKAEGELGDDVTIPEHHPIQRLAARNQLGAVFGKDDAVDQGIDSRVLDAAKVARTWPVRSRRAEEIALLVARRQRLPPYSRDDIEIKITPTIFVLHAIDPADIHGHAEALEVGLVEKDPSLVTL